ncbi:MAG TPA: apolipoprotein N-acyltransferase [Streptosporangiaceae bacterium]|nr:apolipoprotein N-acyltransferase [Streptosporangiaceae bacterium]
MYDSRADARSGKPADPGQTPPTPPRDQAASPAANGRGVERPRDQAAPATAADAAIAAARSGWPGLAGWWSLAAAFAAGLALAGAFPPVGFWPLAIVGPALLTLAVWGKGRLATFAAGLTCGAVFFLALLSWLVNVAWYAWFTLTVVEAVIFAVLALALQPLLRLRAWPLAVAGWWVVQEGVHDRFPWGGFPWGRLAMTQAAAPTAGWTAIGGPPLLTFLLALAGASVAYLAITALAGFRSRAAGTAAIVAGLATAAALAGNLVWAPPSGPAPTAIIATVQGDVPHARNLPNLLRATRVTANHALATIALARKVAAGRRPAPAVVIWPENSTDIDPKLSAATYQSIALAVDAIGRPVLVGAVLDYPLRNAGQLWLPRRGPVQEYVKRQLVPFGEVIPLRGLLDLFTSLPSLQPTNFTPGHRAVVFHIGRIRLGDVICYEVGFDSLVRSEVLAGANLLTVQTNDADFELDGQMGETGQQLEMARMDAITTGRAVAVASTTGVSAIIGPNGSILTRSRTWQRTVLEARVPLRSSLTPADRVGSWPELAIIVMTVLALLWAVGRARWRRRAS